MEGKYLNEIPRRPPLPTDLTIVGDPDAGTSGAASIAEAVAAGLPVGHHHADLLAWSVMTGAWAPLPFAPLAVNIAAGAAGSIPYQAGPDHTTMLPIGAAGQVLTVDDGGTGLEWRNIMPSEDPNMKYFILHGGENEYFIFPPNQNTSILILSYFILVGYTTEKVDIRLRSSFDGVNQDLTTFYQHDPVRPIGGFDVVKTAPGTPVPMFKLSKGHSFFVSSSGGTVAGYVTYTTTEE